MNEQMLDRIKEILREQEFPYFEDEQIEFYLNENNGNVDSAIYQMLRIKAENSSLNVSGLQLVDTSKYFYKLAQQYRPNNSGTLGN